MLKYTSFFFALILSYHLQSQEENVTPSKKFHAGIIAGISTSQVDGDSYGGFDKVGPLVGAYVRTNLNSKFDVRFEIIYTQKGSRKNPDTEKGDYTSYLLRLNYIDVPVCLRYRYKKIYFEGGASYGRLFSFSEQNQAGPVIQLYPFEKSDVMFFAGFYYQFAEKWTVAIRRSYSLMPIRKFPFAVYSPNLMSNFFNKGYYNSLLCLSLNYEL
ncbi:MAG: PorT family protein [Bacteroidetes bacterium]|nr:PorT family protein [Bacteroidota bacterium]